MLGIPNTFLGFVFEGMILFSKYLWGSGLQVSKRSMRTSPRDLVCTNTSLWIAFRVRIDRPRITISLTLITSPRVESVWAAVSSINFFRMNKHWVLL